MFEVEATSILWKNQRAVMLVSKSLSQHKIKYKLLAMKAKDLNRKVKFLIDRIEDRYR